MIAGLFALTTASLFFGAAFYINFAEQPARMQLDIGALLTQWKPSYKRGLLMQSSLAVISCLFGLMAAYLTSQLLFVAGSVLIVANWPWSVLAMFPLNHRLMAIPPHEANDDVRSLLKRWNLLHMVRTTLGCAAVVVFFVALCLSKI